MLNFHHDMTSGLQYLLPLESDELLPRLCKPGQSETLFFFIGLFVIVSQSLWQRVGWELAGYFRLIFHICVTRFNNSVTHEISVKIRFILCETVMACFLLGRLFNSLAGGIVLVGQYGPVSPRISNPYVMATPDVTLHTQYRGGRSSMCAADSHSGQLT